MRTLDIPVQKEFCGECSLALLHFLRKMPGIDSLEFEIGKIIVAYDELRLTGEEVLTMVRENIGKMGYRLEDEQESR